MFGTYAVASEEMIQANYRRMTEDPTTYHCSGAFEDHLHDTDQEATDCNADQQVERDAIQADYDYGMSEALEA